MAASISTAPVELVRRRLPMPRWVNNYVFSGGAAKTVTVPTGAVWAVVRTANDLCWINLNGTAAIPVADVTDGTGSLSVETYQPQEFYVAGVASFSLFGQAAQVSIAFYREHGGGVLA